MKAGRNYVGLLFVDSQMRYCLLFDFPNVEILLNDIAYMGNNIDSNLNNDL